MTESKSLKDKIVAFFNRIRGAVYFNGLLIGGGVLLFIALTRFEAITGFAAGIFRSAIGLSMLYAFIRFVMNRKVQVLDEIINGNTALALYVLAFAILIAVGMGVG